MKRAMKSSQLQISNLRQNPNCKSQRRAFWSLGLGISLTFGLSGYAQIPNPDTNGLPAPSLPTGPVLSPTIDWVQDNLRIAHLPPADWRQISSFLGGGYQVVAINTLLQWDR